MRTCVAVAFEAEKRPEKVEVDVTAEAGERPVETWPAKISVNRSVEIFAPAI